MPKISLSLPPDIAEAVKTLPEGGLSKAVQAGITAAILSSSVKNGVDSAMSRAPKTPEEKMSYALKTFVDFHRSKLESDEDVTHLSESDAQVYHTLAIAFEFSIRELMRGAKCFTQGSEAEIFRVKAGDSEFVVVKRRYDSFSGSLGTDRECKLQIAARNVAKKTEGVRVPKIFHRIHGEDGSEYIVMEYVKGKTLWNLMLESLANPGQNSQWTLAVGSSNPVARFFEARAGFEKKFDNDTEAETDMRLRYQEYGERIGLKHDLGIMNVDPITRKVTYPNLEPYLEADLKKLSMFDAETVGYVEKKLRKFLTDLHGEGIFHRDLNVRNVMLTPEGDIYVIDFGKGIQSAPNDFWVYDAQEGRYNDDFSIIEQFRAHGPKELSEAERYVRHAAEVKSGIPLQRIAEASRRLGLDPESVVRSVANINMVCGAKYFQGLFGQYVNGTAERTHPTTFIRPNPRKPEAIKASEAGTRQLLAHLLLADSTELEEFSRYLDSVRSRLDFISSGKSDVSMLPSVFGSPAKDERARKYLPVFETAVLAAMG